MRLFTALAFAGLLAGPVKASSPYLATIYPRGARRGSELELRLYGGNLQKIVGLLLNRPGIEVLGVKDVQQNQARATVRIAEDCPLGQHEIRVHTEAGISNLRTFWVGTLPEITEKENNNRRESAQKIPLNVTVSGRVLQEDVDWFEIELEHPMRVNFEVQGVRLGDREFDPVLAIYDAQGEPLASVDDTPLGRMDPVCSLDFEKAGTYWIELREAAFGGNGGCHYRLHVGTFPRPLAMLPAGGRPGEELEVTLLGDGPPHREKIRLPASGRVYRFFATNEHGTAPTPLPMSVLDVPNFIEPDRGKDRRPIPIQWPVAINGVISRPGEVDRYRLQAKRGQSIEILAHARALRSPMDPVLYLRQVKGGSFSQYNDDSQGRPDCRLNFRIPADGAYDLTIYDQLRDGSPLHVYRIEITDPRGELITNVVPAGRYEDHAVAVPAGGRMAVRISTRGAAPGTELSFRNLPPGVTARSGTLQRGSNLVPVVFEAATDAGLASRRLDILARLAEQKEPRLTRYLQVAALVRVRNQQLYLWTLEETLPLAVTKESPFRLEVEPPEVPLIRGSPLRLKVRVHRDAGFNAPIRVRMLYNPPGVGAGQVTVPKNEGHLSLSANGNAPVRTWQCAVVGRYYANRTFREASSAMFALRVEEPWMTARLGKARAEQGQAVQLAVDLKKAKDFGGKVRAELLNLPPGATATSPIVDQETDRVTFDLKLAQNARPGRYRNLVLRLRMPSEQGDVVHHYRGGELRIDRPLRRKAKVAGKKPATKRPAKGTLKKPKT